MTKLHEMERLIRERTVTDLLAAGFTLNVNNGGEEPELQMPSSIPERILGVMNRTDDEYLMVYREAEEIGWIYFVYGNDGWDVINNCTTNLESHMTGVDALIEQLESGQYVFTPNVTDDENHMNPTLAALTHVEAIALLDTIHAMMNGREWNSETTSEIASAFDAMHIDVKEQE